MTSYGRAINRDLVVVDLASTTLDTPPDVVVPATERWHVLAISAVLVTSATAGNRRLLIEKRDSSNLVDLARLPNSVDQAASLTRYYRWSTIGFRDASFIVDSLVANGLPMVLGPGERLRFFIETPVDNAVDAVRAQVEIDREAV